MNILTFLRATDLSALQRTCSCFNQRDLVNAVVEYAADEVVSYCLVNKLIFDPHRITDTFDMFCFDSMAVISQRDLTVLLLVEKSNQLL